MFCTLARGTLHTAYHIVHTHSLVPVHENVSLRISCDGSRSLDFFTLPIQINNRNYGITYRKAICNCNWKTQGRIHYEDLCGRLELLLKKLMICETIWTQIAMDKDYSSVFVNMHRNFNFHVLRLLVSYLVHYYVWAVS